MFKTIGSISNGFKPFNRLGNFYTLLFKKSLINSKKSVNFSTSPIRKAIPPLIWIFVKPISKFGAFVFGRGFRNWWSRLPQEKKTIFISHLKRNKTKYIGFIGGSSIGSILFYRMHIEETPITKRKRFMIFKTEHLDELTKLGFESILKANNGKILDYNSPHVHRALQIAKRLFEANKNLESVRKINWKLTVINDDSLVNACAFQDGNVIVYTGILKEFQNDDEIGIVLGHEMSHAILQHTAETFSRNRIIDILSIFVAGVFYTFVPSFTMAYLSQEISDKLLAYCFELPYSRELESEADRVGLELAARACFDVRYSSIFWKKMQEKEGYTNQILSTHPSSENRSAELEKLIPDAIKLRKQCNCKELNSFHEILTLTQNQQVKLIKN